MKKEYIKPEITATEINMVSLVCVSIVEGEVADKDGEVLTKDRFGYERDQEVAADEMATEPQYGDLWQ